MNVIVVDGSTCSFVAGALKDVDYDLVALRDELTGLEVFELGD